jgi:hypothetical protein
VKPRGVAAAWVRISPAEPVDGVESIEFDALHAPRPISAIPAKMRVRCTSVVT